MHLALDSCGTVVDLPGERVWPPGELAAEVARRAGILAAIGVGRGARVVIAHGGSAEFLADLLAVWTCGAAAACLDPGLTARELANVVGFVEPAVVLTRGGPPQGADLPVEIRDLSAATGAGSPPPADGELDDPALLLFTSGTTGAPKGVVLTFRAVLARIALNIAAIGRETLSVSLVTLPTHFGHGLIGNTLTPLFAGGTVILPERGIALARGLGALVDRHRVGFLSSVPSLWQLALRTSPRPAGGSLRRVHVGSAPLSAALWQSIAAWTGCEVVNCYGITETANWIGGGSSLTGFRDGYVGRPWGGQAAVRHDDGTIAATGTGEIVVQTPSLMHGYYRRDDLTASVLNDGWYRTGDIGTVDGGGGVSLSGRMKDEVNRAGFKIQPSEIDMLLESHPGIAEACCFGVPDTVSGETLAAAVRLADGAVEDEQSLRAWCASRIRREATPERWFFVAEIPRTARGKVSRDAVRRSVMGDGSP